MIAVCLWGTVRKYNVLFLKHRDVPFFIHDPSHRRPKLKVREDDRAVNTTFAIRRVVLKGSRFIDFVWEIHFRYQNAKIKLWMWKWTQLNSSWNCVCVLCNLSAIRGRFRRVFGSVLFAVLFLHWLKTKEGRWLETTESNKSLSYHNAMQRIATKAPYS